MLWPPPRISQMTKAASMVGPLGPPITKLLIGSLFKVPKRMAWMEYSGGVAAPSRSTASAATNNRLILLRGRSRYGLPRDQVLHQLNHLVDAPGRLRLQAPLAVDDDCWSAERLGGTDLRIRHAHLGVHSEGLRGGQEGLGRYPGSALVELRGVLDGGQRGLGTMGDLIHRGQLLGPPDGIEHGVVSLIRDSQRLGREVCALEHGPIL